MQDAALTLLIIGWLALLAILPGALSEFFDAFKGIDDDES